MTMIVVKGENSWGASIEVFGKGFPAREFLDGGAIKSVSLAGDGIVEVDSRAYEEFATLGHVCRQDTTLAPPSWEI